MDETFFPTWGDFEVEVDKLFSQVRALQPKAGSIVSKPLFRGLSDANWKLETTLERFTSKPYTEEEYFRLMRAARHPIESFLDKRWKFGNDFVPAPTPSHPPYAYDFMVYLRHHGFPSPILDWSRSPYIAAYFAFRSKGPPESKKVAIYAYIGDLGYGHGWSGKAVNTIGPTIITDRRHHIQQCEYTYAVELEGDNRCYCDHESAFASPAVTPQDFLRKFTLPYSERDKVLAKLDFMNINSYSLFGDEEHLMDLIAYREIEQRER